MCKILRTLSVLLILPLVLAVGCKSSSTTVTPPLAPGYQDQVDQKMDQTLQSAHNFYVSIKSQYDAKQVTLSDTEKKTLNTFAITLNVAQQEYLAFKNGQVTEAQAQQAVDQVSAQQTALQSLLPTAPTVKPQSTTPPLPDESLTRS